MLMHTRRRSILGSVGLLLGAVALGMPQAASADIVHNDDVIIQGSLAVGFDAVNGENFGADTIRLKENNLRIHFEDTSNSASFPSNDWRIVINDSTNGGSNYFAVEDSSAGRIPFRIEAGARSNALYVDSGGDVGLGTSNPVVSMHIVEGNTPTVRLEQNGSSGFTAQTWDLAGNEANFFIRDVTNGSKLPFRIQPSAPTNSIYLAADGDIGLGTASPGTLDDGSQASLHVQRNDGDATLLIEEISGTAASRELLELRNNGPARFRLVDTANTVKWEVRTTGSNVFVFDNTVTVPDEMTLNGNNGNLTVLGTVTANGVNLGSSRELKQDIRNIDAGQAVSALEQLEPVHYAYKAAPEVPHLGFIAEDVPELVSRPDRASIAPMDIVAVVTKVVQEQQKTIQQQHQTIEQLNERVKQLEQSIRPQE